VTYNFFKTYSHVRWRRERADLYAASNVLGGEAFAESFDKYIANHIIIDSELLGVLNSLKELVLIKREFLLIRKMQNYSHKFTRMFQGKLLLQ